MMTEHRTANAPDNPGDDLDRRFLFGDVTPDEREHVETRMADDQAYFEALCALEDELVSAYARGTLPEAQRVRFAETLAAYPRRRERLHEIESLRAVLAESSSDAAPINRPKSRAVLYAFAAVAASIIVAAVLWNRAGTDERPRAGVGKDAGVTSQPVEIRTFVLALGQTRDGNGPARSFPNPGSSGFVDLVVDLPSTPAALRATLTRVGDPTVIASGVPRPGAPDEPASRIAWRVSSSTVSAGDYLLTLRDADETVASAYFRVLR